MFIFTLAFHQTAYIYLIKIETILNDKTIKAKGKVEAISKAVLDAELTVDDVLAFAAKAKDADKGTCIESLELATRLKPEIVNQKCFSFLVKSLNDDAPRVKWESAKTIANTVALHKTKLNEAIAALLINTEDPGTVVRWSAAHALAKIIILNTSKNKDLIPAAESIVKREENNAIRKIYLAALKKVQKSK